MPGRGPEGAGVTRDLRPLFDPAHRRRRRQRRPGEVGQRGRRSRRLRGADRHPISLVNRRGGEVLGHPCVTSVEELDGPVDLAVIAVPEAGFEEAVDGVLAKGARAIVAITAGLGEAGDEGRARQEALIARVRDAGAVLVGPNCLGLVDNTTATYLSSNAFAPGDVALLSQSGNLAIEVDRLLRRPGDGHLALRLARQPGRRRPGRADRRPAPPTRRTAAIAVYVEDFRDGRGFVEAVSGRGRRRYAGRGARRRRQQRRRPRRAVPHRLAHQRRRGHRGGVPGRRRHPGAHAARARRRAAGAAPAAPSRAARGSRCSPTAAATA